MSASTSPAPPVEPPTENLNDLSLSSSDKTESIPIPTPSPPSQTTSQVNEQGAEQPVMDIEPPTPPTSNPTPNSAGMNNSPSVLARDMLLPSTSNTSLNSHSGSSQGISEGGSRVSSLESSLASPPRSTPGSNLGSGLAQRSGGLGSSNGSRISGLPASSNSGTSSSSPVPTPVPGAAASGFPGRTGGGARIPVGLGSRPGLGGLSAQGGGSKLPPSLQAKIDAMATRNKAGANATPTPANGQDSSSTSSLLASAANRAAQPTPTTPARAPVLGGWAARRAASSGAGGLSGGLGGGPRPTPTLARQGAPVLPPSGLGGGPGRRLNRPGGMTLSSMAGPTGGGLAAGGGFSNFSKIVDPSGKLNFDKKAILHAEGVNFSNGATYKINKDEMILQDELGKGNYGEVRKVYHKTTKVTMAMKEIRLELDESKLNQIIMELDILHRAIAPEIIEFYGAFMVESCVYYCMEFMDAGSMDALNLNGIPEKELARITKSMIKGLKFLKDEMQVMHRDVKPTNLLANKKGQIKLCDFGVSGQLEKSLAKTNIGCQSYMAPERIKGESTGQVSTYTVSSDIWSVGLTIIELAMGCYPYPPETYSNVFAQLQAIVHGPPPRLPEGFSDNAQDFVARCLLKQPDARPTYAQLLEHPWMKEDEEREVDMVGWVAKALEVRAARRSTGAAQSSSGPEVAEGHATGPAATQPTQTANADPSAPPPAPSN